MLRTTRSRGETFHREMVMVMELVVVVELMELVVLGWEEIGMEEFEWFLVGIGWGNKKTTRGSGLQSNTI